MSQLRTEKDFPRLFSISTVNLRNHKHSDFLFHPLRTDITGQSNLGKSTIAAEALQLIFIANKNYWSSPTDTTRRISGMVLKNEQGDGATYIFTNVEVKANQFLAFGVYIRVNSDTPEPFIVQDKRNLNWDMDSDLAPFRRFLCYKDFLTDNIIPSKEQIKRRLDMKGYNLEFFDTRKYHKFLVKNQIIPFDINNENDLKIYAEILQSFSRGKILEDKGKSMSEKLKNFLFADNNEQNDEYKIQKKEIEESQKKFREQSQTVELIEQKQSSLLTLLDFQEKKEKAKQTALFVETAYYYQQYQQKLSEYNNSQEKLWNTDFAIVSYEYVINEMQAEGLNATIEKKKNEIINIIALLRNSKRDYEISEKQVGFLKENVKNAEEEYRDWQPKKKKIENFEALIRVYKDISVIEQVYQEQQSILEKKEKLYKFLEYLSGQNEQNKSVKEDFEKSMYKDDYKQAKYNYENTYKQLSEEISRLEQLEPLFDKTSQNSFAQWAIHEAKRLNREQESVLFHFIDKTLTKPTHPKPNARFIIEPKKLLENLAVIESDDKGFWVELNGIGEYIKAVENPLFNNPETLPDELRKYGDKIKAELENKQAEFNNIKRLDDLLVSFGFNQYYTDLFQNQEKIANYLVDELLNLSRNEFKDLVKNYLDKQIIEDKYSKSTEALSIANRNLSKNQEIKNRAFTDIHSNKTKLRELLNELNSQKSEFVFFQNKTKEINVKFNENKIKYKNFLKNEFSLEGLVIIAKNKFTIDIEIGSKELNYHQRLERINKELREAEGIKGSLNTNITSLSGEVPKLKESYLNAFDNYQKSLGIEFDKEKIEKKYTIEDVNTTENEANNTQANYKIEYLKVLNDERFKVEKSEILFEQKNSEDPDLYSLAKVLLTDKIVISPETLKQDLDSGVAGKLKAISDDLLELSNKNKKIIRLLFSRVYDMIGEYESKVKNLQDFFEKNPVAGNYHVELERTDSKVYPKNWIDKFKKKFLDDGFDKRWRNMHKSIENTADNLIIEVFKEVTGLDYKSTNPRNLLEPKSYFDLEIYLKTPTGKRTSYTGGTGYALLALLSIARLSEIDKDKNRDGKKPRKGIRYMAIDEVAGLGENFDMLIQVAKQYDYQIITMTISFIGNIGEEGIYYYNLMRGTEDENATPFAILHKQGITKEQFAEDEYKAAQNYTQNKEEYQKLLDNLQNG